MPRLFSRLDSPMQWLAVYCIAALAITGCGPAKFPLVPVSGVVTLDGKPLANARIAFEPKAKAGTVISGPGSYGRTHANGRFTLVEPRGRKGAVAGPNTVWINTGRVEPDPETGDVKVISVEVVPQRYSERDGLTFDVPAGGTSAADFHLTTK